MNTFKRALLNIALATPFALPIFSARAATTPDPGDYVPLPAGTNLAVLYMQRQYADNVYVNGNKAVDNLGFGLDLAILRSVNYFTLGGMPADWQVILPMDRQHTDLTDTTLTGVGDLIVGGTAWTMTHPDTGEHLGWSAFLTVPTGAKNRQGLAVSNDRYGLDLQSAYTRQLSAKWSLDLIGQVEFYTKDQDSKVKTDPLYRLFGAVRYQLTPKTSLQFQARQSWGTRQDQFGVSIAGGKNDTNLLVGVSTFLTPRFNMLVQLADDVHVENGPRFFGLQTRFVYVL